MNGIMRVNNELERKWKEADKMKFNKPSWYFPGQTWRGDFGQDIAKAKIQIKHTSLTHASN